MIGVSTEKLVDGDFLAKLISGSMEAAVGAVDEAVGDNAELFGGDADCEINTIATYPDHFIVANEQGEFYRGRWKMGEDGVELSEIEEIEVPVFEAAAMGSQVRQEAREAVTALLADDAETADEKIRALYRLVKSGVRLTAEGVEDLYQRQKFGETDWLKSMQEHGAAIRAFLGVEAVRLPATSQRFASVIDVSVTEAQAESKRESLTKSLGDLHRVFGEMRDRIALAKQIDETRVLRDFGESGMAAADFVEFVGGLGESLDSMIGVLGDARAVAEDGSIKCLARVHDAVADHVHEWALASAFCEKLARRFGPGN
jgi:hypothetical protein